MKPNKLIHLWAALLSVALTLQLHAQSRAFTYQGRLSDGAGPANGSYDLTFALYDAESNGTQQGVTLTNTATAVSNGLFTVALDFGNEFPGADRWLEIGVRTNGGVAFATLTPRQPLTATPYAIFASTAADANAVAGSNILGNISVGPTLAVESSQGDVNIQSQVNATLDASLGNVTVKANSGNVNVQASRGNADFNASLGNVTVQANLGSVTVKGFNDVALQSSSSTLSLSPSEANLQIPGGNVKLSGVNVNVTSTGSGITLNAGAVLQISAVQTTMSGILNVTGPVYAQGVQLTSDRNAKEHFVPLDTQSILAKVAALPVTEWNYRTDRRAVRHIGPMAQDFHAAFGLDGKDDKHISVIDEGGVALAAIQGLNQKLEQKQTEIAALKQTVNQLKQLVNAMNQKLNGGAR